ncbi:DUF2071 domain-containing protein [Paenibacillus sp. BR2-3]|uniref:YqjF family protein n=1 Tax=Paenibacillus sp. BR2-3 TaxID=3048494 RepID=UPI003977C1D2
MKQVWKDLLFAHWPVNEAELLSYIPPGLELQKWEGKPWISVSPFLIHPLRLRGIPPIPWVNRFLELNIRTYVERNGKPGVFFLNLDASNRVAVTAARAFAHLPYRYADMKIHSEKDAIRYISKRSNSNGETAVFNGIYKPVSSSIFHAQPGTLVHWLTERYCLYAADPEGRLYSGEIHHLPWPLQEAELRININTSTKSLGLVHDEEPSLLSFTKRLDVLFWPLEKA